MVIQAGAAEQLLEETPERARGPLEAVQDTGRQTIVELTVGIEAKIVGEIVEVKTFTQRSGSKGVSITLNDDTDVLQI